MKQEENQTNAQPAAEAEIPPLDQPPPMIVRSASYRCDDGKALYVDVLTDESIVAVRDSRGDTPKRLHRESDAQPFTGEGRTLTGVGPEVRYSSQERASQSCRQATA